MENLNVLYNENASFMINLIQAKTSLETHKKIIKKIAANEFHHSNDYMFDNFEKYGNVQIAIKTKTKNAALSSIKDSLYSINNEISTLESHFAPVISEEEKPATPTTAATEKELLDLFMGV